MPDEEIELRLSRIQSYNHYFRAEPHQQVSQFEQDCLVAQWKGLEPPKRKPMSKEELERRIKNAHVTLQKAKQG